jgi:hypothetical protein
MITPLLLAPVPAKAEAPSMERFAKSIVSLYVAAEMCKQVKNLHSENYATVIRNYLQAYFQPEIPYWVLPIVNGRVNNHDRCVFSIEQNIASYQEASEDYAATFPERPLPPALDNAMMLDSRVYVDETKKEGNKEHYLTPTVLLR